YDPYASWLSRKAEIEAETERLGAIYQTLAAANERFVDWHRRRGLILTDDQGNVWGSRGPDWPHWDNPPSEPRKLERGEKPAGAPAIKKSGGGRWGQIDHHTLYSHPLKQNRFGEYSADGKGDAPGTRIKPGLPPSGNEKSKYYDQDGNYLGYLSKAGR